MLHAKNIFLCRWREISNRTEGYIDQMVFLKSVKGILLVISPDFPIWHYLCQKASQFNSSLISATLLAWKCMEGRPESIHQNWGLRLQGDQWWWDCTGENVCFPVAFPWGGITSPVSSLFSKCSISFSLCALFLFPHLCMPSLFTILCSQANICSLYDSSQLYLLQSRRLSSQ